MFRDGVSDGPEGETRQAGVGNSHLFLKRIFSISPLRLLSAATLLAGLTTTFYIAAAASGVLDRPLKSTRLSAGNSPFEGFAYFLPKRIVAGSVWFELLDCQFGRVAASDYLFVRIRISDEPNPIVGNLIPDPSAVYAVNVNSVVSWFAKNEFTMLLNYDGFVDDVNYNTEALEADLSVAEPFEGEDPGFLIRVPIADPSSASTECGDAISADLKRLRELEELATSESRPSPMLASEKQFLDLRFRRKIELSLDPRPLRPEEVVIGGKGPAGAGMQVSESLREAFGIVGPGLRKALDQLTVSLFLVPVSGEFPRSTASEPLFEADGILYRMPLTMKVSFCIGKCEPGSAESSWLDQEMHSELIEFPQLGQTVSLPMFNRPFTSLSTVMDGDQYGGTPNSYGLRSAPRPPSSSVLKAAEEVDAEPSVAEEPTE